MVNQNPPLDISNSNLSMAVDPKGISVPAAVVNFIEHSIPKIFSL